MNYLPGSTPQLVSGGPLVLSREERDCAFVVLVTQEGFHPLKTTGKRFSHPFVPLFGLALVISDKILLNVKTRRQEAVATFIGDKSNVSEAANMKL